MSDHLNWPTFIYAGMKKADSVFYLLKKNFSYKTQATCKLGLYKSLLVPVLTYGFYCTALSRADMKCLEKFHRRVVQWITCSKVSSCISQLRLLNLLPVLMFLQLSDILLLAKLSNESIQLLLQTNENLGGRTEYFKLPTTRTERTKGDFTLRTCRLITNLHEVMDFSVTTGLKERILAIKWKFVNSGI